MCLCQKVVNEKVNKGNETNLSVDDTSKSNPESEAAFNDNGSAYESVSEV